MQCEVFIDSSSQSNSIRQALYYKCYPSNIMKIFTVFQLSIVMQLACGIHCEECIDTPESYKDVFENVVETGVEFSCVAR